MEYQLFPISDELRTEYEHAEFDNGSGMESKELKKKIELWMKENDQLPMTLLFAGARRILFENCRIQMNPMTPFSGKFCHDVLYHDDRAEPGLLEHLFNDAYCGAMEKYVPDAWQERREMWDSGACCPDYDVWHVCPDWKRIIRLGISGMIHELKERQKIVSDNEQAYFLNAAIIDCENLQILLRRFLVSAKEKGMTDYAEALGALENNAPKTLYQVLILMRLYLNAIETGKERARTYGAVDQIWYPYYEHDIQSGLLTEAQADDLIGFFLLQTSAEERFADQPMCLGSVNENGLEEHTDFALKILEIYDKLTIHNPKIHIRYPKNSDSRLLDKALDMIRNGHNSIVIINDETVYAAYEKIGIDRDISRRYLPIGCYEPVIPDLEDGRICSAWINMSKAAEWALTGGENILVGARGSLLKTEKPDSYKAFLKAYYDQLYRLTVETCDVLDGLYAYPEKIYASPLLSASVEACVRNAKDVYANGMDVRNMSLKCFAVGTAVDSILAVKEFVYDKQLITIDEMIAVLKDNWQGHEFLRKEIMKSQIKWGNHISEADKLAKSMYDLIWNTVKDRTTANGGRYRLGCDSVAQADYGHKMGATMDGRYEKTLTSRNMRPNNGMEREGITAFMQSVAGMDATRFADAAPLDLWIHPSVVKGQEGLKAFHDMLISFFEMGGFCMHANVLQAQTLLDAREHPENYRQLQIRVCGWNEYFVNLSKELQDDFIQRSIGLESCES